MIENEVVDEVEVVASVLSVRRNRSSMDFVLVDKARDVWVCRGDIMAIGGEMFIRQFTPDGRGGGFVALKALVPPEVPIPYDWEVYPYTVVFPDASLHMAGQGPKLSGLVMRVSREMSADEREEANLQAAERFSLMSEARQGY